MSSNKGKRRKHHGIDQLRGIQNAPRSASNEQGRFGRLFGNLPPLTLSNEQLLIVAESMREGDTPSGDSDTPAGFTFLGQFIDHDITLDVTSSLDSQADPEAIRNFRTPTLELDSVYGSGPDATPHFYDATTSGALLVGTEDNPDDVPRNRQGTAIIGDPRNDENGIISQLQLLFLRFHNSVLRLVESGGSDDDRHFDNPFEEAQRLVRWHYQWIIVHEFLPFTVDASVLESIHRKGLKVYKERTPVIPVEFSVAAYRFGHSMIRNRYDLNSRRTNVDLFQPPADGLTSFAPVPRENVIDWSYFFRVTDRRPQPSRKIDAKLANELFALPFVGAGGENSLAMRNLLRGQTFSLPAGEAVAHRMKVKPLSPDELGTGLSRNPLWFYILKEAELNPSDRLGEVGGRIVAETLIGLLRSDPMSYLSMAPDWTPTLPARNAGQFTMTDLIDLAQR